MLDHSPSFLPGVGASAAGCAGGLSHAYQPCVIETDDSEYSLPDGFRLNADPTESRISRLRAIYHARSRDLTDRWEVLCKDGSWSGDRPEDWASTLFASTDGDRHYYHAWHVGDPSVVFRDGVYYMAFSSTSKPLDGPLAGIPSGMMLCVMGATSVDGVHWHKREEPLLIAQCDSVFPPRAAAARVGDFHRPTLMWDEQQQAWSSIFDYYNASLPGTAIWGWLSVGGDFGRGVSDFVHSLDRTAARQLAQSGKWLRSARVTTVFRSARLRSCG